MYKRDLQGVNDTINKKSLTSHYTLKFDHSINYLLIFIRCLYKIKRYIQKCNIQIAHILDMFVKRISCQKLDPCRFFSLYPFKRFSLNSEKRHKSVIEPGVVILSQYSSFPRSHLRATQANYIKRKTFIYYAACAVNSPEGNKGTRSRRGA